MAAHSAERSGWLQPAVGHWPPSPTPPHPDLPRGDIDRQSPSRTSPLAGLAASASALAAGVAVVAVVAVIAVTARAAVTLAVGPPAFAGAAAAVFAVAKGLRAEGPSLKPLGTD
jgi:hypothetical protein